jgi:hypothetical protein
MADRVQAPVVEGQHFAAAALLTELRATQQALIRACSSRGLKGLPR